MSDQSQLGQLADRAPTPDEQAGIRWWNALTESERARWLREAHTAIPAEAWAEYKARLSPPYPPA